MAAGWVKATARSPRFHLESPWGAAYPAVRGGGRAAAERLAADSAISNHSVSGEGSAIAPEAHPFVRHPHRTLIGLSFPVMLSLIPEPLTGLVDTAFVKTLGAGPVAALGVGASLFSVVVWAFNFLGIGTQTEVAHAYGANREEHAGRTTRMALALGGGIGAAVGLLAWPALPALCAFMGTTGEVQAVAVRYLEIRLLGGPAVLATMAALGALRGVHDMRTPLYIALGVNAANAVLDALFITGWGPFPALGVAGAAWATVVSQWAGTAWAIRAVGRRLHLATRAEAGEARKLLVVGRDLFLRTGLLVAFILFTTRAATRIDTDSAAAQQAIRQVWLLTAMALDAFAASAQSLVGYFLGAGRADLARRVCGVACAWGVATGAAISLCMLQGEGAVAALLVPPSALGVFQQAWWVAAAWQPLNALSFVTDGIHWGARDYRYLRNAMFTATATGIALLGLADSLTLVWAVTAVWVGIRAAFGVARVWPAVGRAPLRSD